MLILIFLIAGLGVAGTAFLCTVFYYFGKDRGYKQGRFEGYTCGHEIGFKTGWSLDQKRRV